MVVCYGEAIPFPGQISARDLSGSSSLVYSGKFSRKK